MTQFGVRVIITSPNVTMRKLRICTINIGGLNCLSKRQRLNHFARHSRLDIICLQETHLEWTKRHLMNIKGFDLLVCSTQTSTVRGVAILAKSELGGCKRYISDTRGRWAIAQLTLGFTICTIYGSNQDEPDLFDQLEHELVNWGDPLIICGDFNVSADWTELGYKYTGPKPKVYNALKSLIISYGLTDVWGEKEHTDPGFTYFSYPHQRYTKLDYFLITGTELQRVSISKLPKILSDHNPLILQYEVAMAPSNINEWTFERKLLLNSTFVQHIKVWVQQFFDINRYSTNRYTVWDSFKAALRGEILSFSAGMRKTIREENDRLIKIAADAEEAHQRDICQGRPGTISLEKIRVSKAELHKWIAQKHAEEYYSSQDKRYETGEQAGKLLALRIRQTNSKNIIKKIQEEGKVSEDPHEIRGIFQRFYQKLYTEEYREDAPSFIAEELGPRISEQDREDMDADFTLSEIIQALQDLALGKAAGTDRIPLEVYKTFQEILAPLLLDLFNGIVWTGNVPESWKETNIVVFHKKGKPRLEPGSYRPISLINVDNKIYARIIAKRMGRIIGGLVSPWQHGFIPGRGTTDHINRAITLFDIQAATGGQMAMILLDAEKAFDRVTWQFLWGLLEQRGFGTKAIRAIKVMYRNPKAKVQMMGGYSGDISISRGTRQGCPCSPILFALYIDPLIRKIISCQDIKAVEFKGYNTKLLAYADDLAITTSDPDKALPAIVDVTKAFGRYSGYILNEAKTQIICTANIPYRDHRYVSSAGYLGIKINSSVDRILEENYTPVIDKIKGELRRIDTFHLSIIGRVNVLKMTMLPKLMYLFRAIPLMLNDKLLKELDSLFIHFVWKYGKIRRSLKYLSLPYDRGGLSAPNIGFYFLASRLGQMTLLFDSPSNIRDSRFGNHEPPSIYELLLGKNAVGLLMRKTDRRYYNKTKYKVIESAGKIWNMTMKLMTIPRVNYYTPIWNSNVFPQLDRDLQGKIWEQLGVRKIGDLISDGRIKNFGEIQQQYAIPPNQGFKYLQITKSLVGLRPRILPGQKNKLIDYLLAGGTRIKRLYRELLTTLQDDLDKTEATLIIKLGDAEVDIDKALLVAKKVFRATNLKSQHYQTIFNLYFTPAKLFKWGIREDDKCPRCHDGPADLVHMFYQCPGLSEILKEIEKFWEGLLGIKICLSSTLMLLGVDSKLKLQEDKEAFVFLGAAVLRMLLAAGWKDPVAPSFQTWLARLLGIHNIEAALYAYRGRQMREWGGRVWLPLKKWRERCIRS